MSRIPWLLLALILILSCCNAAALEKPTPVPSGPQLANETSLFSKQTYPRIDGSTATIPLSEAMAAQLLKLSEAEAQKSVKHNTTHSAYLNLIEGKADLILVTEPSQAELALAKEKKITLEVVPVVKDAFVFLVNTKNPVNSLTINQIQAIYQGKLQNWREVGGENKPIIAFQRPANSGSQTLMENLVMKGLKIQNPPVDLVPAGMDDLIEEISGYNNSDRALGYSVYYFASAMYNRDSFKLLGVNGVKPNHESISKGTYPYPIAYYAVFNKAVPAASPVRKLLAWLLSPDGQRLAVKAGYVPVR